MVRSHADPRELPAEEWDALVARPPASINCSRAWVTGALATVDRGRTPHLLAAWTSDGLAAVLPLAVERSQSRTIARLVGTPYHDLADVLVRPRNEGGAHAIVRALRELIDLGWSLELGLVDPHGALAAADRNLGLLRWEPDQCAPLIDLRGDWRGAPSAQRRQSWRRHRRRLEERHAVCFGWIEGPDVEAALPEFVKVRDGRLRLKGYPLDRPQIDLLYAVVPHLAGAGRCAFAELRVDGAMVARDLYLLEERVALMWLRALDVTWGTYPCGHLLLRWTAESLVSKGYEVLDLGCGAEPYKFALGARPRLLLRASGNQPPPTGASLNRCGGSRR